MELSPFVRIVRVVAGVLTGFIVAVAGGVIGHYAFPRSVTVTQTQVVILPKNPTSASFVGTLRAYAPIDSAGGIVTFVLFDGTMMSMSVDTATAQTMHFDDMFYVVASPSAQGGFKLEHSCALNKLTPNGCP